MRLHHFFASAAALLISLTALAQKQPATGYPITPVPFTAVKVTDAFWGQRLRASREVTIPLAFSKCEETGRYTNFSNAAAHLQDPAKVFHVNGVGYSFDDTDPYKTIEGASYLLQTYPDKKLEAYIDSVIDVIASAQEPDGYLYTARTQNPADPHHWAGERRWVKEEDLSHELYNLGHMVEGAIAHYQATGSRKFLDIAIRYADCVCREVGPNPGQACVVPGHQIAEMALAKLYLVTGDRKYLDEAKFFLDYRGKTTIVHDYSQAHKPVIEQNEAVGHAVRAAYMYAGMADVAALTGDSAYIHAIDAIWDNIVTKKLYITGGIGATASGEAFGRNYQLPNMSAYCETCAAIGNVYVNYRLFLLHGEAKYYDVLERTLYNGLISGVSLDGGGFFYPNPLASMGQHQRQPWFGCACCPSNICRFIPSLPGYIYAVKDRNVYVNLFLANESQLTVGGKKVTLTQQTDYPWNGDITLSVKKNAAGQFAMKIRIPGWVRGSVVPSDLYEFSDGRRLAYAISVNGQIVNNALTSDGYCTITRKWKAGDCVKIHFDMEARTVRANAHVQDDRGMISVERGPLVYCAEHPDNDFDISGVLINQAPKFTLDNASVANTPIKTLTTDAQLLNFDGQGRLLTSDVRLTLIPYYAWCHRGSGKMQVWLAQDLSATTPAQPATLASESTVSASHRMAAITAVNDRLVPKNAEDRSVPYWHTWPKKATTEWIQYDFAAAATVQSATVYWYDDGPWGGCRVPQSWRILYRDAAGEWQPVQDPDKYPTQKGTACAVNFEPVQTSALRLEIVQPEDNSVGVFEWSVR
ncbi:MAG: glycoside hydrolase family 127 protein [Bacteroidaceae bacterium]|nr:glycoside hydrolase family 127 protein [Bacteroidaceae bacterium]